MSQLRETAEQYLQLRRQLGYKLRGVARLRTAVPGKNYDSQQTLGTVELRVRIACRDSEKLARFFSCRSVSGVTSPRLRGEVGSRRDAKHRRCDPGEGAPPHGRSR